MMLLERLGGFFSIVAGIISDPFSLAILFGSVLLGILVGLVIEFLREHKQRRVAEEKRREIVQLRQEVTRLRAKSADQGDDLPRIPIA